VAGTSQLLSASRVDFVRTPVSSSSMDRADDRGFSATTRAHAAPRVTLNWQATPFTCRKKEETKWTRERNGRRVLRTLAGGGKVKYWRAPRPRPQQHRRQRRRRKKEVVAKAIAQDTAPPKDLQEAHETIQILQAAVRGSLKREQKLQRKLRHSTDRVSRLVPTEPAAGVGRAARACAARHHAVN